MGIAQKDQGHVLVIELEGELMGGPESDEFRSIIDDAIKNEKNRVVIDMGKVNWMNSSGLGMLMSALTSLRGSGGDLKLANMTERVRRPIQITRLDSVFDEYDSVEDAVRTFAETEE
ncbi:anti-sigma factor antagonist [candidate division KSB1 bacterium]|nr:STAS domain-containing protein [candidate division KSB1 bacterium]RQW06462.1 MAG: anti-sigma factor antagonist [candidate division KSB1 bacterium]